MEKKLTIKELAPYLPYGLKVKGFPYSGLPNEERNAFPLTGVLKGLDGENAITLFQDINGHNWDSTTRLTLFDFKPLLRPLSSLTEEINWGNQTYAIIDLFEIGDDGGYIYEYDHGNIKLISQLKTIAEYNYHHDINYLPYPVVQVLIEHHFDVFGLIDRSLALPIDGKEVK